MNQEFKGQVAVVTGGTSGLGFGISKAFLQEGAEVIALYRSNDERAKKASAELLPLGKYTAFKVDISDEEQMKKTFAGFTTVDFLVNCAGLSHENDIEKLSMSEVRAVFETQIFGKIIACRCALPFLQKSEYPRIVNIASRYATKPLAGAIPLTAAEAGIIMFTKNLALEWSKYGIKVNCVSPSLTVNTGSYAEWYKPEDAEREGKKNPSGRLGRHEDTANAVLFFCSTKSDYITGVNLDVNGGNLLI